MESTSYHLSDVLTMAGLHPFYNQQVQYPPNESMIRTALKAAAESLSQVELEQQPLLLKNSLYETIQRLIHDTSPQNTYRRSVYVSTTGGGSGSIPLFFATDVNENRRHRAAFGRFLQTIGIVQPGDWVISLHTGGRLYRSLDLMLEILENAQASVLSGATTMAPADVLQVLIQHQVNVITGDGGQIVGIAHHISKLPETERRRIRLEKIIYTSEAFTTSQRKYVLSILGPIKICSILGSAEAGPYAASCDYMASAETTTYTDFIFDTRAMIIEIFPSSVTHGGLYPTTLPDGQQGIIAQTSLSRLRHPLVRYITGDIGSLHNLPERAQTMIPKEGHAHLRVLRLYGRDHRFSFTWNGEYFDFAILTSLLEDPELGVLQWQVILDKMEPSMEAALTVRLLMASEPDVDGKLSVHQQALFHQLRTLFCVEMSCEHRFKVVFADDIAGFEKSATGNKVIKFIDRLTD